MDKKRIFERLGKIETPKPLEPAAIDTIRFDDPLSRFLQALKKAGGRGFVIEEGEIEEKIAELFGSATIASIHPYGCRSHDPNRMEDPRALQDIDAAIVHGEFGVAENGAVWIAEAQNRHRALYTIVPRLAIVVKREAIVDTMADAYRRIEAPLRYGLFLSGPSKTADIEQSLVIGAHGAIGVDVLLV